MIFNKLESGENLGYLNHNARSMSVVTLGALTLQHAQGLRVLLEPNPVIVRTACTVAGVLYPAYASFRASDSPQGAGDAQQWLTYWGVYGSIHLIELAADRVVGAWFPYYFHAKLAFFLWLQLPRYRGAMKLHDRYVKRFLGKFGRGIDDALSFVISHVDSMAATYELVILRTIRALRDLVDEVRKRLKEDMEDKEDDGKRGEVE